MHWSRSHRFWKSRQLNLSPPYEQKQMELINRLWKMRRTLERIWKGTCPSSIAFLIFRIVFSIRSSDGFVAYPPQLEGALLMKTCPLSIIFESTMVRIMNSVGMSQFLISSSAFRHWSEMKQIKCSSSNLVQIFQIKMKLP